MLQLVTATLPIIIVLNFILGIAILSRGFRNRINVLFSLIVLSVALWSFGILGFYLIKLPVPISSGWIILTHFSAALLSLIFLYFTVNFPVSIIKKKYILFFPIIPFLLMTYYLFFTTNIIGGVFDNKYEINSGYLFYVLYVLSYFTIGYLALFMQYIKATDATQKVQIKYVLFGALFSSALATATDLIFPFFNIFEYTWLGPLFTSFLVVSITYAILRHHLFNIRVVATETFTFVIWIILFVKTLLSKDPQDLLINIGLLLAMVIFGILLIRSILNEVKQREKIEKLAKEVERAYELEKKAKEQTERAYELEKKANEELKMVDEAKSQFMAITQHHLRTPLTSMMGYLDLLLANNYGKISVKVKDILKRLEVSTQNEIKIVNELLNVSEFQLGKGAIQSNPEVSIKEILEDVVKDLILESEKKGLYLKIEEQKNLLIPLITADKNKLKMAITNIVDNAVKYTQKGGILIKVKSKDKKLIVEITDTGIGMTKQESQTLFGKTFQRGEEAKKLFVTGKGIGLFLSAKIIEAHKGRIWAESAGQGKGSTFFIELPTNN